MVIKASTKVLVGIIKDQDGIIKDRALEIKVLIVKALEPMEDMVNSKIRASNLGTAKADITKASIRVPIKVLTIQQTQDLTKVGIILQAGTIIIKDGITIKGGIRRAMDTDTIVTAMDTGRVALTKAFRP